MIPLIILAYPCFYVSVSGCMFPFAMITYSVGADVVKVSKAFLEDEEPSFKCRGGGFQWEV